MYVVLRDLHFRISPLFGQNKKKIKVTKLHLFTEIYFFSCFLQKVSCAPTMQTVSWTRNRRNLAFTQNFCFDGCGSHVQPKNDQFPMIADKFFYWKLRKAQPI